MSSRALLACATLAIAIAAPAVHASDPAAAITFECLWWSPAQMAAFDPNDPPPKATRVTIDRWEYTDPVGTPHPDVFDVVLHLTPSAGTRPKLTVRWVGRSGGKVSTFGMERRGDAYTSAVPIGESPQRYSKITATVTLGERWIAAAELPIIVAD